MRMPERVPCSDCLSERVHCHPLCWFKHYDLVSWGVDEDGVYHSEWEPVELYDIREDAEFVPWRAS